MMNEKVSEPFKNYPQEIFDYWDSVDEEIKKFLPSRIDTEVKYAATCEKCNEPYDNFLYYRIATICEMQFSHIDLTYPYQLSERLNDIKKCCRNLGVMCKTYYAFLCGRNFYWFAEDTPLMHFDGDIIITDPCYLSSGMPDEDREKYRDKNIEENGIRGISHSTLYGDWSCYTMNIDASEPFGQFCADGGEVCVALLNDVLKFNPKFDFHIERPWTTTLIKDFCGDVQIKVEPDNENGEEDNYICFVEGHGVNNNTGEPINFITMQTGF